MKKIAILLAMAAAGLTAAAQSADYKSYIQAQLGGGLHSMLYAPADGSRSLGFGGLAGAQYQHMFNRNIGISAGLQASCLNSRSEFNYSFTANIANDPEMLISENSYTLTTLVKNWKEQQNMVLLSLPAELLVNLPMGEKRAFQIGLGATLDLPVMGRCKAYDGSRTTTAYVPATNVTYGEPNCALPEHGFATFPANNKGPLPHASFALGLLADLGVVFNLSETNGLYVGLYGNYLPTNLIYDNTAKTEMIAFKANSAVDPEYHGSMGSQRIPGVVRGLEAGIKIGIRLGKGPAVDWAAIKTAEKITNSK